MLRETVIAAGIVSVCLMVHVAGILLMAKWVLRKRDQLGLNLTNRHFAQLLIVLFTGIMGLHLTQTGLWAVFYYTRGLFSDFETSLYFSMVSFTTIGYGDVLMAKPWRILGAIEGATGVIMLGWSTAFLVSLLAQSRLLRHDWLTVEPERGGQPFGNPPIDPTN